MQNSPGSRPTSSVNLSNSEKSVDEKMKVIMSREEVFKFSKAKIDCQFRCPVYKCLMKCNNAVALKSHISRKHKELEDANIEVTPLGKIKYHPTLLDSVLKVLIWQKKFLSQNVKREADKRLKEIERVEPPHQNGGPPQF